MKKVTRISERKTEHIKINLYQDVSSGIKTGLEKYRFVHEALPEMDLTDVDTSLDLFGKRLSSPILISSMTGGSEEGKLINIHLAQAAQECQIALGLGSQRAALESPDLSSTYEVRKYAPDTLIFANLGAIQLNNGLNLDDCNRVVDMIEADGLTLHLNPLQESLQQGGETNFRGLLKKIETVCKKLKVPVIVKEVGWGISEKTARILYNCGVSVIDVAGAGGTSWSQVEMYNSKDDYSRQMASEFKDWGIPTAASILNVKKADPGKLIFASGGINNGIEIAKSIALGATLVGSARLFLNDALVSAENVVSKIKFLKDQLSIAMFVTASSNLADLENKIYFNEDL